MVLAKFMKNQFSLKSQLIIVRGMAFFLEILIPNTISWYLYPSPTAFGLGAFVVIYLLFRDGMQGQSIAKKLLNLKVVNTATDETCGPLKSFRRNFILIIPLMPLIELVAMLISKDGRRLGDRLAGTQVIPAVPVNANIP